MKKIFVLCFFLSVFSTSAQSVNDYKYVIVPSKFSFLKTPNQYNLNTLTKLLIEKYGFVTYFDTDNLPDEVGDYNCNKLYADIDKGGSFVSTKIRVLLKDCKGNVLFATDEGKSFEKEYGPAYTEALRNTSKSFDALGYKYNGSVTAIEKTIVKTVNDGSSIKTEIIPATANPVVPQGKEVFFAQPISNGFQLVDSAPKVIMKIFNTSSKEVFIAEKGTSKGVVRNSNGNWLFEYYEDGKLMTEIIYVKF